MLLAFDYNFDGEESTSEVFEWCDAATKKDEPAMQVKVTPKGDWHKMLIDRTRTACGKILGAYATRDETYDGNLCKDGCFSPYELKLATELLVNATMDQRAREDAELERLAKSEQEESQLVKDIAKSRTDSKRRLELATGKHVKLDPDEEK